MKVNIICGEDLNEWIIGKFARKLNDELNKMGIESSISQHSDTKADVNHYIIYSAYKGKKTKVDTLMVTHIDALRKFCRLRGQLKIADMGICMSSQTVENLVKAGIPREKLCYINPAHDGLIKPRPITIGIASKIFRDGRKNERYILKLIKYIAPRDFKFKIMGEGWQSIVDKMRKKMFEVEYHEKFDYEVYKELMPTLDYYLYVGKDEGQMGVVDALAAGVPTIVTPQGYHLDAVNGITYAINNFGDILNVFNEIALKKRRLINSVSNWTWEEYAKKHVKIWTALLTRGSHTATSKSTLLEQKVSLTSRGKFLITLAMTGALRRYFRHKNRINKIVGALYKRLRFPL
jgi:glycosyltransferase involved in cell wall biosynthesis